MTTDRSSVRDPEPWGVAFRSSDGQEVDLVLWTGGWADMNSLINGQEPSRSAVKVDPSTKPRECSGCN